MSAAVTETRGRKSVFAGKRLYAQKLDGTAQTNYRRAGSHGFKSLEIVINNPGITFERFIELGGRANDLRWDIDKGSVTLKDE